MSGEWNPEEHLQRLKQAMDAGDIGAGEWAVQMQLLLRKAAAFDQIAALVDQSDPEAVVAEVRRVQRQADDRQKTIEMLQEKVDHLGHVIIEGGVDPGISYPCRCDACRSVAEWMDDAGFLGDITQAERWWDDAAKRGG